jgi:peptide deformylase
MATEPTSGPSGTPTHEIRIFGDPVLKSQASVVDNIDGKLVALTEEMFQVMYDAPGIGLAAPQIGIQKQIFVWDLQDDDGPRTILNPVISEYGTDEWVYEEGCLSIPGLYVEMLRPKTIHVTGIDLDGNDVSFEADELLARLFQHEVDHLNGVLMFERMTADQRKEALLEWRRLRDEPAPAPTPDSGEKKLRKRLKLK